MSNTNSDHNIDEQFRIPQRGGYPLQGNLGLINSLASNGFVNQGQGGINQESAKIDDRLQAAQSYQQPISQNNFGYPAQQTLAPQPTTFISNQAQFNQVQQEPFYQTIPQTMKTNAVGGILENNNDKENTDSQKILTDLAQRQTKSKQQPIAIDSQQINSQIAARSAGIDSQPVRKRREPGILERWNAGGMKNPSKFAESLLYDNNHLDDPQAKKAA